MVMVKNGGLSADHNPTEVLRGRTRDFLARERPGASERVLPWCITDESGVTPERVDEVFCQVMENATSLIDDIFPHTGTRAGSSDRPVDPSLLRDEVEREMQCYRDAVLSRVFLVDTHRSEGVTTIDVCHPATALRARFGYFTRTLAATPVTAKPQDVPMLVDPTGRQPSNPLDDPTFYVGYGVGTDLYRVAASLAPCGVRWSRGLTHEGSEGVRRKLHREDPWRWETSSCEAPGCADGWASPNYAPRSFHEDARHAGIPVDLPAGITVMEGR